MAGKYLLELNQQLDDGRPDSVVTPFLDWGELETDADRLRLDPDSIRAVFFAGGTDVSPSLYGERPSRHTEEVDARRDEEERECFRLALEAGLPIIGICRGAQFLCVMAGGRLCQHLEGHRLEIGQAHAIVARDVDGRTIDLECSSVHHQMQLPPVGAEVFAWAEPRLAGGQYFDGDDRTIAPELEYEAVFYPEIRAVGFQWHPEWMPPSHPCVAYTRRVAVHLLKL